MRNKGNKRVPDVCPECRGPQGPGLDLLPLEQLLVLVERLRSHLLDVEAAADKESELEDGGSDLMVAGDDAAPDSAAQRYWAAIMCVRS